MIGIGDNILAKFRDIVSEEIEYLPRLEIDRRLSEGAMGEKIERIIDERETFDKTLDGMNLKRLKGIVYRANTGRKKLGVVNNVAGVASTIGDSPNQDFLEEVMDFIENDDAGEEFAHAAEDDDADGATDGVDAEGEKANTELPEDSVQEPAANTSQSEKPSATTAKKTAEALSDVGKKIIEVMQIISDCEKKIGPLKKKRGTITNRLKNARTYL